MRKVWVALCVVVVAVFVPAAPSVAEPSTQEVLDWYEDQSTQFLASLRGEAYSFRVEGGTALGMISFVGARDPRGDLRMAVASPFVSGDLRCVDKRRCWFRPKGERTWQSLKPSDVDVDDTALEITGDEVRKTLANATVVEFDPDAGTAVLDVDGEGQVSMFLYKRLLRLLTSASADGTVSETVVELRARSPFQVKAPPRKLREDGSREFDFTVPGVPTL